MKITSVTPFTVRYPEPNDNNNIRYLTFCKVEAEDGTVGWGEAITQFAESTKATALVIEGMARNVIGRDCFDNVAIWRSIKRRDLVVWLARWDRLICPLRDRHRTLGLERQAARHPAH